MGERNRKLSQRELEERRRRKIARMRAERRRKRRRRALMIRAACILVIALILGGAVWGVSSLIRRGIEKNEEKKVIQEQEQRNRLQAATTREQAMALAAILAQQYDYDGAVDTLKNIDGATRDKELTKLIADYEMEKSNLVQVNAERIPHIYFNSLIVDKEVLFAQDNKSLAQDANRNRLTVDEFKKVLQQLYDNGYVLVKESDIAKVYEDGTIGRGNIYLPESKKALILSINDVSYPLAYVGNGIASRLVAGSDGKLTCEYQKPDGTVETGDYDIIPILDNFIEEHPDFSYRGARGILGFTGYNGILGYRTSPELAKTGAEGNIYADYGSFNYTEEIEKVKSILKILYKEGWEFASNGYGGISYGDSIEAVKEDASKWQSNVGAILDDVVNSEYQEQDKDSSSSGSDQKTPALKNTTHILLFPYGTDIANWEDYSTDNEKYTFLKSLGFKYYCNVDSSQYWLQMRTEYLRQGRRSIDGYRLYQELTSDKKRLEDLFDASAVFDTSRPEGGLGSMSDLIGGQQSFGDGGQADGGTQSGADNNDN